MSPRRCAAWRRTSWVVVLLFVVLEMPSLQAATTTQAKAKCDAGAVKWAGADQVVHVSGPVTCTLGQVRAALPSGVIHKVDRPNKIWLLDADLVLEEGAKLLLHGGADGEVNELRLRSDNVAQPHAYVTLSAYYGAIDLRDTRITSWDTAANAPDAEYQSMGRANVAVHSFLEPDGTARESRLDIAGSDLGFLGFDAPYSYGVTWKVHDFALADFDRMAVRGDVINSKFHDNYYGLYTYGAKDMHIAGNEVFNNVKYGIDPHDDSDRLVIENNFSHNNGWHGIICSKRCDHLVIRNNRSVSNTGHGIMLHRSVDDSLVEGNDVSGNVEVGIALFESDRNTIRNNTVNGNDIGVRLSMGASDNLIEGNQISGSREHGINTYSVGSDQPERGDGRPRRNHFSANTVTNNGQYAARVTSSDDNVFSGNTYTGNAGVFSLADAYGNVLDGPEGRTKAAPGEAPQSTPGSGSGYWLAESDGTVHAFGGAAYLGDAHPAPGASAVALTSAPGGGYWALDDHGTVNAFGSARDFGSGDPAVLTSGERFTSLSATPAGDGYWLFTSAGRVFAKGAAAFLGDMSGKHLNGPVLDSLATPSGQGYYMVASDGGIFAFGDARFVGSMGGRRLNRPVVSLAPDPDGDGYWLVASDGGIFAFNAPFLGSMGDRKLNKPMTGIVAFGKGYLMVGEDGGIFNFSDQPYSGSLGARPPASPVVAVTPYRQ